MTFPHINREKRFKRTEAKNKQKLIKKKKKLRKMAGNT